MNLKLNFTKAIFAIIICAYFLFISIDGNFGVIDDHILYMTLLVGKIIPLSWHVLPAGGRFFPLNGQDLNILSYIFAPSAKVFFIFNGILVLIFTFLFIKSFKILQHDINGINFNKASAFGFFGNNARSSQDKNVALYSIANNSNFAKFSTNKIQIYYFLMILVFLFSPALSASISRLFVPEKLESIFLLIALCSYLAINKKPSIFIFCIGVCASFIALFYKETAFILIFTFAFINLIILLANKIKNKILFFYNALLMISCVIWGLCYYFIVYIHRGKHLYGYLPLDTTFLFFRNLFNYTLNEPFLIICVSALTIYRLYLVFIKGQKICILDSMLMASFLHILAFLVLLIMDNHYLLPSYIFAILPIVYFLYIYFHKIVIKIIFILTMLIYIFNALPYSLWLLSFYKSSAYNMTNTAKFLAHYTQSHKGVDIYLDGVGSYPALEVIGSIDGWIEYYLKKDLELKSANNNINLESKNELNESQNIKIENIHGIYYNMIRPKDYALPFDEEILRGKVPQKSGDILIITPFDTHYVNDKYLEDLHKDYDLVYKSSLAGEALQIRRFNIKSIIKYILKDSNNNLYFSNNFFGYPLSYFVFVKK